MDKKLLQRARGLCIEQAAQFIAAADRLGGGSDFPHIVYHLSLLALEEVGKASMLGGGMLDPDRFADTWVAKSLDNHQRQAAGRADARQDRRSS
jgi:AbiV family abortive infection protein